MRITIFICYLFCSSILMKGQTDTLRHQKTEVNISGFLDVFYVYDFNRPKGILRQSFFYNHNRHNEFNVNLGIIKLAVNHNRYRANIGFHAGTYVNDNYANESGGLKSISEANVGMSLNKKNNLWFDLGIFSSHIGFESAVSIENLTLTRSLLAENSPYFLSGARLTFQPDKNWMFLILACNGWQRIQRLQGSQWISAGTQISFAPNDKVSVNWSSFIGTDDPDITRRMRYFNNFYSKLTISDRLGLIIGFDIGLQQKNKGSTVYNKWFSPVLMMQYTLNDHIKTTFRAEYYEDDQNVIITVPSSHGFKTSGFSINLDYSPVPDFQFRTEARWLHSHDKIFESNSLLTDNNIYITTSLAWKFSGYTLQN